VTMEPETVKATHAALWENSLTVTRAGLSLT
jgi:hypothetical protein